MPIAKKYVILAVVIVGIVGAIVLLEARKQHGAGDVPQDALLDLAARADEKSASSTAADVPNGAERKMDTEEGNTDDIGEREERVAAKRAQFEPAKEIVRPHGFINTPSNSSGQGDPFTLGELVGEKVILVDFWTYSCINCQRTLPYLNSWYEKYKDDGLVIVGIHTPEFDFEKKRENVERAVEKYNVEYPVVLDNSYTTWTAYKNRYWPRKYLIGIDGFIRYDHIGEGAYEETERKIVELLNERARVLGLDKTVTMEADRPEEAESVAFEKIRTPETYLGYARREYQVNAKGSSCNDAQCDYTAPDSLPLNRYALSGVWRIGRENATLIEGDGAIEIHFSASKVNLVAGSDNGGEARIYLDGERVLDNAGADVSDGMVRFTDHDLYNLIDLDGAYGEHTLRIEFIDPGVNAFAFTFG